MKENNCLLGEMIELEEHLLILKVFSYLKSKKQLNPKGFLRLFLIA
jgi:hypothetical protein